MTRIENVWRGSSNNHGSKDHYEVIWRGSYHVIGMKSYQVLQGKGSTSMKT